MLASTHGQKHARPPNNSAPILLFAISRQLVPIFTVLCLLPHKGHFFLPLFRRKRHPPSQPVKGGLCLARTKQQSLDPLLVGATGPAARLIHRLNQGSAPHFNLCQGEPKRASQPVDAFRLRDLRPNTQRSPNNSKVLSNANALDWIQRDGSSAFSFVNLSIPMERVVV